MVHGYRPSREAVQVKFGDGARDGSRVINDFSTGIVDGFTKILIMMSIPVFCRELQISSQDAFADKVLGATLASFQCVRCAYTHYDNIAFHHLDALRCLAVVALKTSNLGLGYVTAEKVIPSPISMMAEIQEAISITKRTQRAGRTATRDLLTRVVADFNSLVTVKARRIDAKKKGLLYNLLRCPQGFLDTLHAHYDQFKHTESALPLEVLYNDFYVPGVSTRSEQPQYQGSGKELFQEILCTSEMTCEAWATRAIKDTVRFSRARLD